MGMKIGPSMSHLAERLATKRFTKAPIAINATKRSTGEDSRFIIIMAFTPHYVIYEPTPEYVIAARKLKQKKVRTSI